MKHLKKILGLLLSVVFLWLALRKVEFDRIPAVLGTIRPWLLPFLVVSMTCEHLGRVVRWRVILRNHPIPFFNLYAGVILGYLFNNILPARAGEFARSIYLGRKGLASISEVFGSVVTERFLDGIAVVTMLAVLLARFDLPPLVRTGMFSAVVFYAVVLGVILLLQFRRVWVDVVVDAVLRFLPAPLAAKAKQMEDRFIEGLSLIRSPGPFLHAVFLSYVSWGWSMFTYFLSLNMLNIPAMPDTILLLIGVLSIAAMIPSSPGMIGIFQYCCVLVLSDMLGHPREQAAAFSLVSHLLSYLFVVAIGIVILMMENLSFTELRHSIEEQTESEEGNESAVRVESGSKQT